MNLKSFYDRVVKNHFYFLNDPVIRIYDGVKLISEYDYCVERDNDLVFVDNTAQTPAFALPINQQILIIKDGIFLIHQNKKITIKFYSCNDQITNLENLFNES